MSAPVDPKAAEMWIAGLGMALVEMKDSEITALRAEVASKNEQFQQYARKMEADMNALAAQNEQMRAALEEIVRPGGADGFWECVEIASAALEEKQ